jgi:hypothetical protein
MTMKQNDSNESYPLQFGPHGVSFVKMITNNIRLH